MNSTFQKDQMVKWDPERQRHDNYLTRKYGKGPFKVLCTEDVPTDCTCGVGDGAEYGLSHYHSCGVNARQGVGHHQWVIIKTSKGEAHLSGAWLIHI